MTKLGHRLQHLSIARKITAFTVGIHLVGFIIAASVLLLLDTLDQRSQWEQKLAITASALIEELSDSELINPQHILEDSLAYNPDIIEACLYAASSDSKLLGQYPTTSGNCQASTGTASGTLTNHLFSDMQLSLPVIRNQTTLAHLSLKQSHTPLKQRFVDVLLLLSGLVFIVIAISSLLGRRFSRILADPVTDLRRTSESVAKSHNYHLRAKKHFDDEFGHVVDSFNSMLSVIEDNHQNLQQSEEKFRLISNSSKVGIFQLDDKGQCIYANEEMLNITDLTFHQLATDGWTQRIHPADRLMIETKINTLLTSHDPINIDCRLLDHDSKWLSGHIDPLTDDNGKLLGYVGTIKDITEVKNAHLQMERMAFYDPLTGLANRRLFRSRLDHVLNNLDIANKLCIIFILQPALFYQVYITND